MLLLTSGFCCTSTRNGRSRSRCRRARTGVLKEASDERCTVALLVKLGPLKLSRGRASQGSGAPWKPTSTTDRMSPAVVWPVRGLRHVHERTKPGATEIGRLGAAFCGVS